jgi:hypothetical protein
MVYISSVVLALQDARKKLWRDKILKNKEGKEKKINTGLEVIRKETSAASRVE